jgi:tRNA-specific 2-thiouridylase
MGAVDQLLARVRTELDLPPPESGQKIAVAMSGGVDSSTTAALLKYLGYSVVGVTLRLYSGSTIPQRARACCAGKDIYDAKDVAARMDFPHFVFDFEDRFRQDVIQPFMESYLRGETPIPCVLCNQTVKFRDLLARVRALGVGALVTGHYVRRLRLEDSLSPAMFRGVDPQKDQSYFLFQTTDAQLDFLRFPLGGLKKAETRALAGHLGVSVAQKPESQDICFVARGSYQDMLHTFYPDRLRPGPIKHIESGDCLGEHQGVGRYTVGQRRGIGINGGDPLYVISIDAAQNTLFVGPRQALEVKRVVLRDCNWIGGGGGENLSQGSQYLQARFRSSQKPENAYIIQKDSQVEVHFEKSQEGVSPGQACVLYTGEQILGGGWISRTFGK